MFLLKHDVYFPLERDSNGDEVDYICYLNQIKEDAKTVVLRGRKILILSTGDTPRLYVSAFPGEITGDPMKDSCPIIGHGGCTFMSMKGFGHKLTAFTVDDIVEGEFGTDQCGWFGFDFGHYGDFDFHMCDFNDEKNPYNDGQRWTIKKILMDLVESNQ